MLRIFAKHGTSEKVLIFCPNGSVSYAQNLLSNKHGGSWVFVEEMKISTEYLHFDDGLVYQGFHGCDERYCAAIKNQKP